MVKQRMRHRTGWRTRMRPAAAIVLAATGIGVFGFGSPASAAAVCTTYYKAYFHDEWGNRVNDRWPAYLPCTLKQGNSGDGVRVLQYLLACNNHAYLPDGRFVARDGSFGPITREAVRLMQIDLGGIQVDGEYGPQTADAVMSRGEYPVFKDDAWWFYDCM